MDFLRKRRILNVSSAKNLVDDEEIYTKRDKKIFLSTETKMWLALIVWYLFNFALVRYKGYDFPKPLNDIQAGNHKFSEERGRKTLHGLTSLGVRIVGSEANEQKAVQFIMNELEKIKFSSQGRIKVCINIFFKISSRH